MKEWFDIITPNKSKNTFATPSLTSTTRLDHSSGWTFEDHRLESIFWYYFILICSPFEGSQNCYTLIKFTSLSLSGQNSLITNGHISSIAKKDWPDWNNRGNHNYTPLDHSHLNHGGCIVRFKIFSLDPINHGILTYLKKFWVDSW